MKLLFMSPDEYKGHGMMRKIVIPKIEKVNYNVDHKFNS